MTKEPEGDEMSCLNYLNQRRYLIERLTFVKEYSASFPACPAFLIRVSSAIGPAASIVLYSSFRSMIDRGRLPAFRAATGAAVINKGN